MVKIDKTWKAVVLMLAINMVAVIAFTIGIACAYCGKSAYVAGARAIEYANLQTVMQDDVVYLSEGFFKDNGYELQDVYSGTEFNGKQPLAGESKRLGNVKLNFDLNKVCASQTFDKRIENIESYEYALIDTSNSSINIRVQCIVGKDKKSKYDKKYGDYEYLVKITEKSAVYEIQVNNSRKNTCRLRLSVIEESGDELDLDYAQAVFESTVTNIVFWKG